MTAELLTVRDFLRYALTRFMRAGLYFGHGAGTALDEAAFIILEALSLPIDDINPWLDARLTAAERTRLAEMIDARVSTRRPAAYLLNKAYVQGVPFYVDERVIVPRSYIGEILAGEPAFLPAPTDVRSILDLCTGSGCLAILAAFAFPEADIHAVDLSADALAVARRNVADHGLETRVTLYEGDLFAPLGPARFDLILTNPPYVDAGAMAALPPEFRAEPALALAGGADGLDIVRRILAEAPARLNPGGGLLCEFGTGRGILEAEYPHLDFLWPTSEEGDGEVFWLTKEGFGRP
ncbi:MAG TPA: 50S ribosomal protein L3 N(5)-glutamine methyltransferase [Parvularcula sp.]|nr:50S ribosomal protein L3 N(5)-glutamine methyltransferase [Parvularcula sp.]HBS33306.1 50S ribosomal protein L3 N(5)-glutamine methyltransferase [Parvularcula sp.]HBS36487.1 50S ribosomal protein L3 N(5)-glutamine methyltransferase [Parvularcula sp.]